jgi:hypothetical protein
MRRKASHPPRHGPYFVMACAAYTEQVGAYRQLGAVSGEMNRW